MTETGIGDVRGEEGFFHYRQYDAVELAEHRSLEDVWALLVDGDLPDAAGRTRFAAEVAEQRALPDALDAGSGRGDGRTWPRPLDGLRTVLSAVAAAEQMQPVYDLDHAARRPTRSASPPSPRRSSRRCTVWARASSRSHLGPTSATPPTTSGCCSARSRRPEHARAIEQYLMLTVDHGFNASTFTAG